MDKVERPISDRPFSILGISGSLREGSYNTAALRAARQLVPEGVRIELFDLEGIPPYNQTVRFNGPEGGNDDGITEPGLQPIERHADLVVQLAQLDQR